jgi:molybdopterin converting factor small subunit
MSLQILSFGSITDITGSANFTMPLVADTSALIAALNEKFPVLAEKKFILAVNAVTVSVNTLLSAGDSIAILPPFSGG